MYIYIYIYIYIYTYMLILLVLQICNNSFSHFELERCMYIHICICICVCIDRCMYIHISFTFEVYMYIYIYVYTYTYMYIQTATYWYTCHTRSIYLDLLIRSWVWYIYTHTHVHVHTYMYMYMYIQILCGAVAFSQWYNIVRCDISWQHCCFRIWVIVWRASWGREECWTRPTIAIPADCTSILAHTGSNVKSFGCYRDQLWSDPTPTTLDCKVPFESRVFNWKLIVGIWGMRALFGVIWLCGRYFIHDANPCEFPPFPCPFASSTSLRPRRFQGTGRVASSACHAPNCQSQQSFVGEFWYLRNPLPQGTRLLLDVSVRSRAG